MSPCGPHQWPHFYLAQKRRLLELTGKVVLRGQGKDWKKAKTKTWKFRGGRSLRKERKHKRWSVIYKNKRVFDIFLISRKVIVIYSYLFTYLTYICETKYSWNKHIDSCFDSYYNFFFKYFLCFFFFLRII